MNKTELIAKYRELNESFSQKLIFHIGVNAGFFSELNNMVLAVLYCLKHHICFQLYSDDANFKLEKGYSDIFIPFCTEVHDERLSKLNFRWYNDEREKLRPSVETLKSELQVEYFTQDLWLQFTEYLYFDIPELEIKGKTEVAARQIMPIIWNFNDKIQHIIDDRIQSLKLPSSYTGFQLRGGDKNIETAIIPGTEYITKANQLGCTKNGFILTDDYRIFLDVQRAFPNWRFYTLCSEEEHGYFYDEYMSLSPKEKFDRLINLITAIEVLSHSEKFIGTYNANPGMFLGMVMQADRIVGMDRKKWDYRTPAFYIKRFIKKCLGIKQKMR